MALQGLRLLLMQHAEANTMTTDADLRLVAQAVGFHPTIAHPTQTSLAAKDDCAARWLLPWLQRKVVGGKGVGRLNLDYTDRGWKAHYVRVFEGETVEEACTIKPEVAAALFDICLAIIKENPT